MADTLKRGHCLCGDVVFEYSGPEIWCGHCHCESCRRATASGFTTFVGVPSEACRFSARQPRAYVSSEGVRRTFCGRCGTPISYESRRFPGEIHLYAANLERPEDVRPAFHVHTAEQLGWIALDDALPRHERGSS
ncbi:MAG: GFA family protein [Rhodovibrionaceae bacterium]|nr:GFA family protein [Rhodovibrionaceae bacterium]